MKEALLSLSPTELRTLAASLRSGRLCAPYSASSLGRYLAEPLAAPCLPIFRNVRYRHATGRDCLLA